METMVGKQYTFSMDDYTGGYNLENATKKEVHFYALLRLLHEELAIVAHKSDVHRMKFENRYFGYPEDIKKILYWVNEFKRLMVHVKDEAEKIRMTKDIDLENTARFKGVVGYKNI